MASLGIHFGRRLPAPAVTPPVVVAPPTTTQVGLSLTGGTDNEGSSLTLALTAAYLTGATPSTAVIPNSQAVWSANAPNGVFTAPANNVVGDSYAATVTASYGGFTATATVQVVDKTVVVAPAPVLTGLALVNASVNEGSSYTQVLTASYLTGTTPSTAVIPNSQAVWSANAPLGVFTAPANSVTGDGYTATLTASYGGKTATATLTVVDKTVVVTPPVVTPPATGQVAITATYASAAAAQAATCTFTPLLQGKKYGMCHIKDDGWAGDYGIMFPLLNGGQTSWTSIIGGVPTKVLGPVSAGRTFDDGCGNRLPWGVAFAMNWGTKPKDGSQYDATSQAQYLQMLQQDNVCIVNHSYNHGFSLNPPSQYPSADEQIYYNHKAIYENLNYVCRNTTPPQGDAGYVAASRKLAFNDANGQLRQLYTAFNSQSFLKYTGEDASDGFLSEVNNDCLVRIPVPIYDRILTSRRNMDADFQPNVPGIDYAADADSFITDFVNYCKANGDISGVLHYFAHGPYQDELKYLVSVFDKFETHPEFVNGSIGVWSTQEFSDHQEYIKRAKIVKTVAGNVVTWAFDESDLIMSIRRFNHFSVTLPGATAATSVNDQSHAFNPATGLFNSRRVNRGATWPYVAPVSAARVTGVIPVNTDLEFTSLQAPATDFYKKAFTAGTTVNEDPTYYNGKFRNGSGQLFSVTRYKPRVGQQPAIKQIRISDTRPYGIDLRIVEVRADKSEAELCHFNGPGNVAQAYACQSAPDSTYRLELTGANAPAFLEFSGDYLATTLPALPARQRYPFENFTHVHTYDYQLTQNLQNQVVATVNAPLYPYYKRLRGGRVYADWQSVNFELDRYIYAPDHAGRDQDGLQAQLKADNVWYIYNRKELTDWQKALTTDAQRSAGNADNEFPSVVPPAANRKTLAAWAWVREGTFYDIARYGANANIPDSSLSKVRTNQLYAGDPTLFYRLKKGLGTMQIIEVGNELSKDWKGNVNLPPSIYLSGSDYAYMIYSVYLGREDAGGKAATGVEISIAGMPSVTPDWLMDCMDTLAVIAPGIIPWDYVQVHFYPSTGSGNQNAGNESTHAAVIWDSVADKLFARFQDINDRFLGGKPLIVGEIGADWKPNLNPDGTWSKDQSHYVVVVPPGATWDQKEYHGILYLHNANYFQRRGGVIRVVHYQLTDNSPNTPYVDYSTSGLLDIIDNGNGTQSIVPRPAWYLFVQSSELLQGYVFQSDLSPVVQVWQNAAGKTAYYIVSRTGTNNQVAYTLPLANGGTLKKLQLHSDTPLSSPIAAGTYSGIATELAHIILVSAGAT